jgi:hypothetical protein
MAAHPASAIVHQHVAAASERAQQQAEAAAAAAAPQPPPQPQQRSTSDTARSLLLLAAAALAAGAAAGVLSYLVFARAGLQRERRSRKADMARSGSGGFRRRSRTESEPELTRRSSRHSDPLQPDDEQQLTESQQPLDGVQPQGRVPVAVGWAHLQALAPAGSTSCLAEASEFAAASRQRRSGLLRCRCMWGWMVIMLP